jgi:hypothetical protein
MSAVWSAVGGRASDALAGEQKAQHAALPDFTARLDGAGLAPVATIKPEEPRLRAERVEIPRGQKPSRLPTPEPTPAPRVTGNTSATQALTREVGQDSQALAVGGMGLLGQLQTSVPGLQTSPGPAPAVPLSESANPLRALDAERQGAQAAERARLSAGLAIVRGPGAAQVRPVVMEETQQVRPSAPDAMPGLEPVPEMEKVASWNLDAEARAIFDAQARPHMADNLARVREQLEAAEAEHHAGRAAAVAGTQRKVDAANAEAEAKQARAVGEVRESIVSEQRETLRQQQEAVAGLTQDAAAQRTEALKQVDARVDTDERKISLEYQQAEKQAQEVQRQGEARARQEQDKAGREAGEDASWWEQPLELIKEALDAIARTIDGILSEVRKAVGAILDRAKLAALVLIDETRQWVSGRLDAFGAWLERAVTEVLGERFPELTRELTAFIRQEIEAARKVVDAIAGGLTKTVSALVDGLRAGLDMALELYQEAVKAAAVLARGLASGDWAEAARMLLEGILRQLGIEPVAFYAFTGKIRSSLELIVDDPGAFVGNLVGAVKKGFGQFTDNIHEHLKGGLLQWLFGVVAEGGITLPARFDVAGVFDLVMQVLGLTLSRLRARVAGLIGEENVERIEFAGKFLTEAVAGGLGGLWEQAQEFLGNFWDMVVGGAQEWLVTTLVKKAFVKLASLFNPAGAILQLILTAWDVFQWLRDNARRIAELVRVVTDSLREIAAGSIGKAANWMEEALARMVPVAIHLLGNILGLGGIGEKLRELITRARETIEQAIDKLLLKVLGRFRGRGTELGEGELEEEVQPPEEVEKELEQPITFPAGEEQHRLWVDVRGESAELMVASTPSPLEGLLKRTEVKALDKKSADPDGHVKAARALLKRTKLDTETFLKALAQHKAPKARRSNAKRKAKGKARKPQNDIQKLAIHVSWILDRLSEYKPDHPKVGTYKALSGIKDYAPHHVPPKGLANWVYRQIMSIPEDIRELPELEPVVTAAVAAKKEHDASPGGANLSCILLHENTHIHRTQVPALDAYRAHHGVGTARLVAQKMQKLKLRPIVKGGGPLTEPEDIEKEREETEAGGKDTAPKGSASTQFYLKELDAAREAVVVEKYIHVYVFLESVADVFYRAHNQARAAVQVALSHSIGKDGPPDKQKKAMDALAAEAELTWWHERLHPVGMMQFTRF